MLFEEGREREGFQRTGHSGSVAHVKTSGRGHKLQKHFFISFESLNTNKNNNNN